MSNILDQGGWYKKAEMKDRVDFIYQQVTNIYQRYDKTGKILAPGCVFIDRVGLADVLIRYSRDIFGQKRLEFQIENILSNDTTRRESIKKNLFQFGCRTSSSEPYFYRKIGYLFYWFSLIKPFHLDYTKVDITKIGNIKKLYFNEFTTYALLANVVNLYQENNQKYEITIHNDKLFFRHFLYDLHYRDLSRSSLEFFLQQFIIPIKK